MSTLITKALQRVGILFQGSILGVTVGLLVKQLIVQCWNATLMFEIGSVQRNFIKGTTTIYRSSYFNHLRILGLEPLELRQLLFDLILQQLDFITPIKLLHASSAFSRKPARIIACQTLQYT